MCVRGMGGGGVRGWDWGCVRGWDWSLRGGGGC